MAFFIATEIIEAITLFTLTKVFRGFDHSSTKHDAIIYCKYINKWVVWVKILDTEVLD